MWSWVAVLRGRISQSSTALVAAIVIRSRCSLRQGVKGTGSTLKRGLHIGNVYVVQALAWYLFADKPPKVFLGSVLILIKGGIFGLRIAIIVSVKLGVRG